MKCSCGKKAVFQHKDSALCKEHFIDYFERKVFSTIKEHAFFDDAESIGVAASGGKDSTVLLYLVKKYLEQSQSQEKLAKPKKHATLCALAIDEGIEGYRKKTLDFLKAFCEQNEISLSIYSFKSAFGFSLDEAVARLQDYGPCTICGALRRSLINRFGRKLDVVATGHNLDDECQGIIMNLFKSNTGFLPRLGIRTGVVSHALFSKRVKPLFFCPEKEVFLYSFLKGFGVPFTECPYAVSSYRDNARRFINSVSSQFPGAKESIASHFLSFLPALRRSVEKKQPKQCSSCGEPSAGSLCKACEISLAFVASR
ncbi:MAG TPA: TIGR00269 family protein [Candidatus Woesearchaeota archaeon]|nr:TIGR00269 family protein [Candidatus Woesearchaeota archaeon]